MRFRLFLVPLATALVISGRAITAQPRAPGTDIARVLDRYAQGDPAVLSSLPDLVEKNASDRLLASLQQGGPAWIAAAGTAQQDRRRLAAATFVLDVAYRQKQQIGTISVPLVEWARDRLRETSKPVPAERAWLVATLGLMETGAPPGALAELLDYARSRFKGEARFLMVDAWLQKMAIPVGFRHNENVSGNPYFPSGPVTPTGPAANPPRMEAYPQRTAAEWFALGMSTTDPNFRGIVVDVSHDSGPPVPTQSLQLPNYQWAMPFAPETRLWKARDDYEHARGAAAVAAEAELRLGTLDLAYAKAKDAIDHFQKALKRASSPNLKYLGQLLLGRADEALDRWAEAEAAYRAALVEVPGAPAAGNALVVLLKLRDRAAEAEAIRQTIDPAVADPCAAFAAGDLIPTAALISALRSEISRGPERDH